MKKLQINKVPGSLIIAILIQVAIIIFPALRYWYISLTGKEVYIQVLNRDPVNPFQGHWVRFYYSCLPQDVHKKQFQPGTNVYVLVELDENNFATNCRILGLNKKGINAKWNQVIIRGTVRKRDWLSFITDKYTIDYGIQNYYINQKDRYKILNSLRSNETFVKIKVGRSGGAIISDIVHP